MLFAVTALAIPVQIRVDRAVRTWEFLPGTYDTARVQGPNRNMPLRGKTVGLLNHVFTEPNALIKVPLYDDAYALGVWSGRKPSLLLSWEHEEYPTIAGSLPVDYWKRDIFEGRVVERKVRVDIPLSKLEFATLDGYFHVPFETVGLVLIDRYDEAYPLEIIGAWEDDSLVGVPSRDVHRVRTGIAQWESITAFQIPLRHIRWRENSRFKVFPSVPDSVIKSFRFGERTFEEAFRPSATRFAADEILSSFLPVEKLPQHLDLIDRIAKDIRKKSRHFATPTLWELFRDTCFGWLIGSAQE
jgi:hypothetical protein